MALQRCLSPFTARLSFHRQQGPRNSQTRLQANELPHPRARCGPASSARRSYDPWKSTFITGHCASCQCRPHHSTAFATRHPVPWPVAASRVCLLPCSAPLAAALAPALQKPFSILVYIAYTGPAGHPCTRGLWLLWFSHKQWWCFGQPSTLQRALQSCRWIGVQSVSHRGYASGGQGLSGPPSPPGFPQRAPGSWLPLHASVRATALARAAHRRTLRRRQCAGRTHARRRRAHSLLLFLRVTRDRCA